MDADQFAYLCTRLRDVGLTHIEVRPDGAFVADFSAAPVRQVAAFAAPEPSPEPAEKHTPELTHDERLRAAEAAFIAALEEELP